MKIKDVFFVNEGCKGDLALLSLDLFIEMKMFQYSDDEQGGWIYIGGGGPINSYLMGFDDVVETDLGVFQE